MAMVTIVDWATTAQRRENSDVVTDYVKSCGVLRQNFITIDACWVVPQCAKQSKKRLKVGQIPTGGAQAAVREATTPTPFRRNGTGYQNIS